MGIGMNLKKALKQYNLTVAELSRKTGISTNTLYAMIRRDNKKIDPNILFLICENSDITIFDLIDDYENYMSSYFDLDTSVEDLQIGSYILTQIGNENMIAEIVDIYHKLNDTGKEVALQRIQELLEIPKYRKIETPDQD